MNHANSSSGGSHEAQKLLKLAAQFLSRRDFSSCRKLALQARQSDPDNPDTDQILAVADVLNAAGQQNPPDWHSILQIPRPSSKNRTLVRTQFEKLRALLEPGKNGFVFSKEALWLVNRAWSLLLESDPEKKTYLRNGSENGKQTPKQKMKKQEMVGKNREGDKGENTFWTVCPYCYYMFEYAKVYEGCCLKCQNCRFGFHGVVIKAPSSNIMVEGKEQYKFSFRCFRLKFVDPNKKVEDADLVGKKDKDVVEISDDSGDDDDSVDCNVGLEGVDEEQLKTEGEGAVGTDIGGSSGKAPVRRVKTTARRMKSMKSKSVVMTTKKIMGNSLRSRRIGLMDDVRVEGVNMIVEDRNGIEEGGSGNFPSGSGMDGLDFFEGVEDIFVGLGDSPI